VVKVTAVDVGDGPPIAINYSIVRGLRFNDRICSLLVIGKTLKQRKRCD